MKKQKNNFYRIILNDENAFLITVKTKNNNFKLEDIKNIQKLETKKSIKKYLKGKK